MSLLKSRAKSKPRTKSKNKTFMSNKIQKQKSKKIKRTFADESHIASPLNLELNLNLEKVLM